TKIRPDEVTVLLNVVGVESQEVITELETLARDAGKQGWWHMYSGVLPLYYQDLLWLEDEAESDHAWTANLVPGLLQTVVYASESISRTAPWKTPGEVATMAQLRVGRQT